MPLLSKAEHDYLTANRQFNDDYGYTIKSRLEKKLQQFISQELPILVEKGYLTDNCKLTEFCKVHNAPVAQLAERGFAPNYDNNNERKSPSRDLNPGPKVSVLRQAKRPQVYETFALPAELLGQNKAISAARYLMLRAKINITEISFLVV
jgi:hypothetical protein